MSAISTPSGEIPAAIPLRPARDVLDDWTRAMHLTGQIEQHPERLLADVLQDVADTSGDAPALIFQGNE
jgi:hypothetical protein